jgi:UDP-N-acetylglucosamine 2-epimerase (non-hydrolysing)
MKKIMAIFGTRPEAVKMAPLVQALKNNPQFETILTVTAQHREMLDQVLELFNLVPDEDLNLMEPGQTLQRLTGRVIEALTPILEKHKPDLVLVHGDTTTTFAASLAAFYLQIPVGHVEAGLRTPEIYNPFPEEMNRRLTSQITKLHFAPTQTAKNNLLKDGINPNDIYLTGNTVIDALLETAAKIPDTQQNLNQKQILVTAHRRENWGEPMAAIARSILRLVNDFDDVSVLFPIHKNPIVRETVQGIINNHPKVTFVEPLDYEPFVKAMKESYLIMTDSGGVQEEAPSLGKPVLVLRTTTERPEAVEAGTVALVGIDEENIYQAASKLITDSKHYTQMAQAVNPYGDGLACGRIIEAITGYFN